jgi:hypothetical protein
VCFAVVGPADEVQRLFGMNTFTGGMQLIELASGMRPARQFGDALGEQGFVAAVVILILVDRTQFAQLFDNLCFLITAALEGTSPTNASVEGVRPC